MLTPGGADLCSNQSKYSQSAQGGVVKISVCGKKGETSIDSLTTLLNLLITGGMEIKTPRLNASLSQVFSR